ncbi:MAG TPA: hypothetical protein VKA46_04345 [Gemmataceae bacterium]|nr:hypothetical protein [Gemmataceae bacterium]
MTTRTTRLFDRQAGRLVEATLYPELPVWRLLQVESVWGPWRRSAVERLLESGTFAGEVPQHWHWDWTRKAVKLDLSGYRCVGIECAQEMQGLMMLAVGVYGARLPPSQGRPFVYVDYLESAPWNVRPLAEEPRYGAVGMRLLWAAVELSVAEGLEGRLGLHSLPQSEAFYGEGCGMAMLGVDPDYESLTYFEFDRPGAEAFLARGG